MRSSIDNSSGFSIASNYQCHCQSSTEPHEKTSLPEESNSRKTETISTYVKTGNKNRYLKRFKKLKNFYICLLFSFALNIGLIITAVCLGITLGKSTSEKVDNCPFQQLPGDVFKEAVCTPCDYLGSTLKAEDTLFDVISPCGYRFCCVRYAELQKFFLLMLQESYTSEEKFTWRMDVGFGSAFLAGITLTQESRLMVPRYGYDFIYSVVTFKCQHNLKPRLHLINKQHKERPNAGVQQLLLSKSSECGPEGFYTSFLSGVLELKRNDEISVSLTNDFLSSVYRSSLSNFFGVYVI